MKHEAGFFYIFLNYALTLYHSILTQKVWNERLFFRWENKFSYDYVSSDLNIFLKKAYYTVYLLYEVGDF